MAETKRAGGTKRKIRPLDGSKPKGKVEERPWLIDVAVARTSRPHAVVRTMQQQLQYSWRKAEPITKLRKQVKASPYLPKGTTAIDRFERWVKAVDGLQTNIHSQEHYVEQALAEITKVEENMAKAKQDGKHFGGNIPASISSIYEEFKSCVATGQRHLNTAKEHWRYLRPQFEEQTGAGASLLDATAGEATGG